MLSPPDPADGPGTIGVEAFDATYGVGFQASDDSPHAVECELVEDGGAFVAHQPTDADRPRRVAFVDGTLRTEARLTPHRHRCSSMGTNRPRFDQVTTGTRRHLSRAGGPSTCPTTAMVDSRTAPCRNP